MRGIKRVVILPLLFMSAGAFAATPQFGSSAQTQYARQLSPPPGKAIVYIYRRLRNKGGLSPTIWLNNYKIGRLVPGSFTVWQLAPGQLNMRVDGTEPVNLSLTSRAGNVYLFRVSVKADTTGRRAELESLPAGYRSELADCRLIKNPRDVTETAMNQTPTPNVTTESSMAATTPAQTSTGSMQATNEEQASASEQAPVRKQPKYQQFENPIQAGGVGLLFKTGALSLSKQTQTILSSARSFDKSASSVLDVESYYEYPDGLAVGGEYLGYKANFTTVGQNDHNTANAYIFVANVKQFFRADSSLQPYIGAGIGVVAVNITGSSVNGNAVGAAYQLVAGLEYRTQSYGFFAEARTVSASAKDKNSQTVDVSSSGLLAGVAFHF